MSACYENITDILQNDYRNITNKLHFAKYIEQKFLIVYNENMLLGIFLGFMYGKNRFA